MCVLEGLGETWEEKDQLNSLMDYSCFPTGMKALLWQKGGDRKEIPMCCVATT